MSALLTVHDLRGGYGETDILNGINLELTAGEILTVAGTNGAGKSTFAKAVVGLLPRRTGSILFDGTEIIRLRTESCIAAGIGYVPQVANVFHSLTVKENLQVVTNIADKRARIDAMLAAFPALVPLMGRRAGGLSGGERQLLAVARALMPQPKLLILDEPTAALSPAKTQDVFELITTLPRLGVAVLLVEQRARQALAISHRGCILDAGKVAMEGPAQSLLHDERAAELYLGQTRHSAGDAT